MTNLPTSDLRESIIKNDLKSYYPNNNISEFYFKSFKIALSNRLKDCQTLLEQGKNKEALEYLKIITSALNQEKHNEC